MQSSTLYDFGKKHPSLSLKEERRLLDIYFDSPSKKEREDAATRLLLAHTRLLFGLSAKKARGNKEIAQDIFSACCVSFLKYLPRFNRSLVTDEGTPIRLGTYMRASFRDTIALTHSFAHTTVRFTPDALKHKAAIHHDIEKNGSPTTREEIERRAHLLNMTTETYSLLRNTNTNDLWLDALSSGSTDATLNGAFHDAPPTPEDIAEQNSTVTFVRGCWDEVLQELTQKNKSRTIKPRNIDTFIAIGKHRLFSDDPTPFHVIGQKLGVTKQRVQQIDLEARALLEEKIREKCRQTLMPPPPSAPKQHKRASNPIL